MNIYELSLEVEAEPEAKMYNEAKGGFVYLYVRAKDLESSIARMKEIIEGDNYNLIEIEYVTKKELEDYEQKEDNFPTVEALKKLKDDDYIYSPFYTFLTEYEH